MASTIELADLEISDELGRGATSRVSLCVERRSGARYALKAIEKRRIVGEKQLERLYREKAILSELDCPLVARFYRTLQDEANLYLLLELATGGELLWHMRRQGGLAPAAARCVIAQLLVALEQLLAAGVLYRDIKPPNLLFTGSGELKLVDFGHAKRVTPDERSTSVVGTPHYASPEAVRGDGHGVSAQLWAVGVLLFESIDGTPPFASADDAELRRLILEAEPPLERLEAHGLDAHGVDLVRALLTKDEDTRLARFPGAFAGVQEHPWFESIDWAAVKTGRAVPPGLQFAEHEQRLLGVASGAVAAVATADDGADPFTDF